jgi:hypothetical protein
LNFLKQAIQCTPHDELKTVQRFVDNSKKRKSPNRHFSKSYRLSCHENLEASAQTSTTVAQKSLVSWWDEIGHQNIVALDCEMVTLVKKNDFGKFVQQAATVGIVDYNLNQIYDVIIRNKCFIYFKL